MANKTAFITSVGVGICVCHTVPIPMVGVVVSASTDKSIESLGAARVGDIVLGNCGHVGVLIDGSTTNKVNNRSQCTITSPFSGCFNGVIVTGANSTTTG